jgi:hypothetical protein
MRKTRLVGGALALALAATSPAAVRASHDRTLILDVALDARTFTFDRGVKPFESNPPDILRGDTFIVNGRVYRGGTIPSGQGVFSPDTPGAIGDWLCRGVFLVGFPEIADGAPIHVDTTQLYLLREGNLVTEGLEGTVTTRRAVTGGTGRFAGAVGQVKQEVLGSNTTGLFNLRLTFTFRDR